MLRGPDHRHTCRAGVAAERVLVVGIACGPQCGWAIQYSPDIAPEPSSCRSHYLSYNSRGAAPVRRSMLAMPFTFAHRDTVDSPYATQLVEGFRRLRFVPTLEHEFREAYAETNLGRVRLSLILALALLAGVTGVDWWTLPEPLRPWSVAVRIGAVCPFVLLALVASFRSAQRDRLVGYVVLAAIVAGFVPAQLQFCNHPSIRAHRTEHSIDDIDRPGCQPWLHGVAHLARQVQS